MPDTGYLMPDAGYRMSEARCRRPEAGGRRSGARQVAADNGQVGRSTRSRKAAASCRTPHAGARCGRLVNREAYGVRRLAGAVGKAGLRPGRVNSGGARLCRARLLRSLQLRV